MIQKKYFNIYVKSLIALTAVSAVVFLVLHFLEFQLFIDYSFRKWNEHGVVDPNIDFLTTLVGCYGMFLPLYIFDYLYSRKKQDILFSLPISRRAIAMTRFCAGYLSLALSFSFPYWVGVLFRISVPYALENLCFVNFLSYFPVALVLLFLCYAMGTLFTFLSRNRTEGTLTILLSQLFFLLLNYVLLSYMSVEKNTIALDFSIVPLSGIFFFTSSFKTLIGHSYSVFYSTDSGTRVEVDLGLCPKGPELAYCAGFVLLVLLALLGILALLWLPQRQRSEESGEINTSWLSLRGVLPLTFLGAMMALSSFCRISGSFDGIFFVLFALVLIMYLILDMVRCRKIGFRLENAIWIAVGCLVAGFVGFIGPV